MTDQRHAVDNRGEEFPAREPSIPETHDSFELTDESFVVYDREDSRQWIWADEGVHLAEHR